MTIPSELDIKKLKTKLDGFLKKLNTDGSAKRPMDDNLAKGLMRDAVRKKWMHCPTKLAFLLQSRIPDMNPATRTKWLHECNICKGMFKEADINIDHIEGEKQFIDWGQAKEYAASILDVPFSGLQALCIACHKTKTRCEALGIDWTTEEGWKLGKLEQEFTRICDSKAKGQKEFLEERGIIPASNEELRKKQIRQVLMEEKKDGE